MRCFVVFVTAVCFLFLLKLRWPKNTSVYDLINNQLYLTRVTLDSVSTEELVVLNPNNCYNNN